jgi:signal transduction histidine kinase
MAYVNAYLQFYAAIIMAIILVGNLFHNLHSTENSVRVFYLMLFFDVIMLAAGSADNYLLYSPASFHPMAEPVAAGISDFLYFMIIGHFTVYLDLFNRPEGYKAGIWSKAVLIIGALSGIFWFVSDFSGSIYSQSADALTYGPMYYIGQAGGYLMTAITIGILISRIGKFKRDEAFSFVLFIAGPLIGSLIRNWFKDIILMPLLVTLSLVVIQVFVQGRRELIIKQQQVELSEMRNDLLLSRMKPHFIYNVLNTIYALCDISVEEAKNAIAMFARYLRTNLVDLDSHRLISFEEEIEHVENYLAIEKLRFGDKLKVTYDIKISDFLIPPLTLQAIVENAVRHGIEKKSEGGSVSITTRRTDENILITVKDTGVGFDISDEIRTDSKDTKRKHIGIYSASYRLKSLCGGKLVLDSKEGEGSCATIMIPADREIKRENTGS